MYKRQELYDLKNDLGESNNLVDTKPELAKQLHQELKAWRDDLNAQMPMPNPDYTPESE